MERVGRRRVEAKLRLARSVTANDVQAGPAKPFMGKLPPEYLVSVNHHLSNHRVNHPPSR